MGLRGYESAIVGGALDRLERGKLVERSEPSHEVYFYTILASPRMPGGSAALSNSSACPKPVPVGYCW